MKVLKLMAILMVCFMATTIVNAGANRTTVNSDIDSVGDVDNHNGMAVDTNGNILPYNSGTHNVGSSSYKYNKIYANEVVVSSPMVLMTDTWDNAIAITSGCMRTVSISTATLVSPTSYWALTTMVQYFPGPVNLTASFETLKTSDGVVGYCDVYGKNSLNEYQYERLVSSNSITTENAGSKAFIYVSSCVWAVTWTDANANRPLSVTCNLGIAGTILGFKGKIQSSNDVLYLNVRTGTAWKNETADMTVSATNNTWTLADVPDGADDYLVTYWGKLKQ